MKKLDDLISYFDPPSLTNEKIIKHGQHILIAADNKESNKTDN